MISCALLCLLLRLHVGVRWQEKRRRSSTTTAAHHWGRSSAAGPRPKVSACLNKYVFDLRNNRSSCLDCDDRRHTEGPETPGANRQVNKGLVYTSSEKNDDYFYVNFLQVKK